MNILMQLPWFGHDGAMTRDAMEFMHTIVAKAIHSYLASQIKPQYSTRRFFRLDGFEEQTYAEFIRLFEVNDSLIEGQPAQIRSVKEVPGYERYALEEDRSPTWYRNNVPRGYALILIFNARTTDAQSLKDIFPITESVLITKGLEHLITASTQQSGYQLNNKQVQEIKQFVQRFAKHLASPQLHDLVGFLTSVAITLKEEEVAGAIAVSLPHLGLFSASEFARHFDTSRGDRLLRENQRAALLGFRRLEDKELERFEGILDEADFDEDTAHGGLSSEEKRHKIRNFLREVLNRDEQLGVLQIDWREISPVLYKPPRKTKEEKRREVAEALNAALEEHGVNVASLSEGSQDAIQDIIDENEPRPTDIETLLDELGDDLPSQVKRTLKKLRGPNSHQTSDFLAGLVHIAVDLSRAVDIVADTDYRLVVKYAGDLEASASRELAEALFVFHALYGGIEQWVPSITWQLGPFWTYVQNNIDGGDDADDEEQREKVIKKKVEFDVAVESSQEGRLASADLIWLYRSDGPNALTALHLNAAAETQREQGPSIPVYNTCVDGNEISDLDLSRPIASLGTWYVDQSNLRQLLEESLKPNVVDAGWQNILIATQLLEQAWNSFVTNAQSGGLYTGDIPGLLNAYQNWLGVLTSNLKDGRSANYGFRETTKAWIVGHDKFDDWAVVPMLHPLKLQWWIARSNHFNRYLQEIIDNLDDDKITDEKCFQRELSVTFNSGHSPAILALPGNDQRVNYFLPVNEIQGYELYRREDSASIAYGLDPELVTESEGTEAVQTAARDIARIIENYVETYPYVRDGLEVYIVKCRDGSLPGSLAERLEQISRRRKWNLHLNLIVHTTDRGAPLFQRVSEWIKANEQFEEQIPGQYFPQLTVKVMECELEQLFEEVGDTDLVVLADVLAERGQRVQVKSFNEYSDVSHLLDYHPTSRTLMKPFERREQHRSIDLHAFDQPALFRYFYNSQWAAQEGKATDTNTTVQFQLEFSLRDWEHDLNRLHKKFNWVVCYDPTVDRFLLQATCSEAVQVIRYSLGLGPKRRHNLTVSSSRRAQDIVVSRLAANLKQLLPQMPLDYRQQIANRLVQEAKSVSGDIVLRAAGPGAYLNELIGLIVAKTETERRYREQNPHDICAWIYLDDFAHWFGGSKFPDLLFVAVSPREQETPTIHLEIIEAKCVSDANFSSEATDAQRQVAHGVNRLAQVWRPGNGHLDAFYWYDQFHKAFIGNLDIEQNQDAAITAFTNRFSNGNFELDISGHAWAMCYDSNAGVKGELDEGTATIPAANAPSVPLIYHDIGRSGLVKQLQLLTQASQINPPEETWSDKEQEPVSSGSDAQPAPDDNNDQMLLPGDSRQQQPDYSSEEKEELSDDTTDEQATNEITEWMDGKASLLTRSLRDYSINVYPVDSKIADIGPSVVRFKVRLRPGEKLSRLQNIAADLQRMLALESVPIIENVSGTHFIGVDLPHPKPDVISHFDFLHELDIVESSYIPFLVGVTPDGRTVTADLKDLKHLLVSGSTGSGKTIFLYSFLVSLLYQFQHQELFLILIDPKQTDFIFFEDIPHLLGKNVVIESEEAIEELLKLTEQELPARTHQLRDARCRDIQDYNAKYPDSPMAPIIVVIDEYADLVQVLDKKEREHFETQMVRLAQRARNVGIHLVIATQRPSSDIVTSRLKTNLPARIAFRLPSYHDSMTILDQTGAENLLGKGDMLFKREGATERLQGFFVDTHALIRFLRRWTD